jgi:hypothetical protein
MRKPGSIVKPLEQRLRDLDDHLYLLTVALDGLRHDRAFVKSIAAELRVLVCLSSHREGLLWRLTDELGVSDVMKLKWFSGLNRSHPFFQGLLFIVLPVDRPDKGHPKAEAVDVALRYIIQTCTAVCVSGQVLTHDYLIKAVAQQMGSAHEADEVEPALMNLSQIFANGIEPYVEILAKDADLVLEVGERVIGHAVANHGYRKKVRVGR